MSELPEDVRQAAMKVYVAYVEENGLRLDTGPTEAELLEVCGRAIVAERERCAKLADAWMQANGPVGPLHNAGMRAAAEFIASDIREPSAAKAAA